MPNDQAATKKRPLVLMNGRWGRDTRHHIYIAAHSMHDAAKMLQEYCPMNKTSWYYEIKKYFNIGSWGRVMDGIKIERGAWEHDVRESAPRRIV